MALMFPTHSIEVMMPNTSTITAKMMDAVGSNVPDLSFINDIANSYSRAKESAIESSIASALINGVDPSTLDPEKLGSKIGREAWKAVQDNNQKWSADKRAWAAEARAQREQNESFRKTRNEEEAARVANKIISTFLLKGEDPAALEAASVYNNKDLMQNPEVVKELTKTLTGPTLSKVNLRTNLGGNPATNIKQAISDIASGETVQKRIADYDAGIVVNKSRLNSMYNATLDFDNNTTVNNVVAKGIKTLGLKDNEAIQYQDILHTESRKLRSILASELGINISDGGAADLLSNYAQHHGGLAWLLNYATPYGFAKEGLLNEFRAFKEATDAQGNKIQLTNPKAIGQHYENTRNAYQYQKNALVDSIQLQEANKKALLEKLPKFQERLKQITRSSEDPEQRAKMVQRLTNEYSDLLSQSNIAKNLADKVRRSLGS